MQVFDRSRAATLIVGAALLSLQVTHAANGSPSPTLKVTVTSKATDPLILETRLTLHSDRAVRVGRSLLPWESARSLVLLAAELPAGWEIPSAPRFIEDPGPAETTLEPGRTVSGTVDLRKRFPELPKRLNESDVIVFWTYQLTGMIGDKASWTSERAGGWVLLKQASRH